MREQATLLDAVLVLLAFTAGAAALACAFFALFEDREALAGVFGGGGLWLAVWAGARAVLPARSRSRG